MHTLNKTKLLHYSMLLITAFIWGMAFVVQAIDNIPPFFFTGFRAAIGSLVLIPVFLIKDKIAKKHALAAGNIPQEEDKKALLIGGLSCGFILTLAANLQQIGLSINLEAGKAGFISTLYIVLVPIVGIFIGKKCHWSVWISVLLAVIGLYLICVKSGFSINKGDLCIIFSAISYTGHIIVVDHFTNKVDGVKLSCIQFAVCTVLSLMISAIFEHDAIDLHAVAAYWYGFLYMGVLSCGVAYTFQIIGQRGTNPTVASLVMSFESCFSVLGGFIFMHEILTLREWIGCILMFVAVILTQVKELFSTSEQKTN